MCFTVNRSKSLDKCPEKASESSSSSADLIHSSSSLAKSSSAMVSPKSSAAASSSSMTAGFADFSNAAHNMHMHVSHGKLSVEAPVTGKKTLRFYDALGNVIRTVSFMESSISVDISGQNRSAFVVLDVGGKRLLAKQVKFR